MTQYDFCKAPDSIPESGCRIWPGDNREGLELGAVPDAWSFISNNVYSNHQGIKQFGLSCDSCALSVNTKSLKKNISLEKKENVIHIIDLVFIRLNAV